MGEINERRNEEFSKDHFHKLKNKVYAQYKLEKPISSIELIDRYDKLVQE
ncbi:MAG: hypothetical protein LBC61_03370 [Candidatus Peribacteria bacterium]|jgi:hypothetical protein|nr:hypothetical protein [Candidatus Peribacteria bacterium]